MLAALAWQAFFHVNPFDVDAEGQPKASERELHLASVGALLMNELATSTRGEKRMRIQFLSGGPRVIPYSIDGKETDTGPQK